MNIIEACRLLDKFGGYMTCPSEAFINSELECGAPWGGVFKYTDDYMPILREILRGDWLYYNDKFECLTCTTCFKLLQDMDGLAPVCECEERTIKSAPKQGNIPREDIQEAIENVLGSKSPIADNDEVLLYEFINDCQIDGVLYRAGERVLWKKSKAESIENNEIIEIASNNPYWPPRVSAQYPGMIEVNYLRDVSRICHYNSIEMHYDGCNYHIYNNVGIVNIGIYRAMNDSYVDDYCIGDYEVSPEEYHRILNLFKASGLEVKGE